MILLRQATTMSPDINNQILLSKNLITNTIFDPPFCFDRILTIAGGLCFYISNSVAQFYSRQYLFLVCSKTLAGSFYRDTTMVIGKPFFSSVGCRRRRRKLSVLLGYCSECIYWGDWALGEHWVSGGKTSILIFQSKKCWCQKRLCLAPTNEFASMSCLSTKLVYLR